MQKEIRIYNQRMKFHYDSIRVGIGIPHTGPIYLER